MILKLLVFLTKTASFVEAANDEQKEQYLKQFRKNRLLLITHLQGNTWLVYPTNESEAQEHLGAAKPNYCAFCVFWT